MSWLWRSPAPIDLYSVANNIYVTRFAFIRGQNVSNKDVKLTGVFILSGMTGERLPMLIKTGSDWVSIEEINLVPPNATFELMASLDGSGGISMNRFMNNWGVFSFVARYGGNEFTQQFDDQAVLARFAQMRAAPHVTRR